MRDFYLTTGILFLTKVRDRMVSRWLSIWEVVRSDVMEFLSEFHKKGILSEELGAAFIALIPKKIGAVSMKDFCPMSLIGSIYKIIAKILAGRPCCLVSFCGHNQPLFMGGKFLTVC